MQVSASVPGLIPGQGDNVRELNRHWLIGIFASQKIYRSQGSKSFPPGLQPLHMYDRIKEQV